MNQTFRLRRFYRNLGIAGLVFSAGMNLLVVGWLLWGPAVGPWDPVDKILIPGVLVAAPLTFGWMLLAYARASLTITDGSVVKTGVLRRVEIRLAELTELHWLAARGGSVVMCSRSARIAVDFTNYERGDWTEITRLLRRWAPRPLQQRWERFCYLAALPRREQDGGRAMRDDEALLTRFRFLATFILGNLLAAIAFAVRGWWFHEPRFLLLAPIVAAPILLSPVFAIYVLPAHGIRTKGRTTTLAHRTFYILWLTLMYAYGCALIVFQAQLMPHRREVFIVGWVLACAGLFLLVRRSKRLRRDSERYGSHAAEEWERLEREGGN